MAMEKSPVFDQTYKGYVTQIATLSLDAISEKLGLVRDGDATVVRIFDEDYRINGQRITDSTGRVPDLGTCVIIAKYLLNCPATAPADGEMHAYKDFKDARPLIHYFTNNAERRVSERFAGRPDRLAACCRRHGGDLYRDDLGYDVKFQFSGLPRVPVFLLFNDVDESFPAECKILFRRSAETYLDMESLAMLGVLLAQKLTE